MDINQRGEELTETSFIRSNTLSYLNTLEHEVTEVRILRKDRYLQGTRTYTGETLSGYYEPASYEKLIKDIEVYNRDPGTKGIYTTLQDCVPELLHRAANRLELNAKGTTSDHDIRAFTVFPIDHDPKRPAGISASESELESAKSEIKVVCDYLIDLEIPESAIAKAMSSNGWHLLVYLNELENTEANAVRFKGIGDLIAEHFNLDQTIYNPSRIWKLYGTISRKGDNTEERPHRAATIWLPEKLERIDFVDLESKVTSALGRTETQTSVPSRSNQTSAPTSQSKTTSEITLREWLDEHKIAYIEKPYKGTYKYQVDCPHDATHKSPDAWVTDEGGTWQFSCSHNSCKGERSTWKAFKAAHGIKSQNYNNESENRGKPGRPSRADKAKKVEIPEKVSAKPVVMLHELTEIDNQTIVAERSRDVVSDDVAQHMWRNGSTQMYRRGEQLGSLRASDNGLIFMPSTKDSIGGDIARKISLVKYGSDGLPTPVANAPTWLASDILFNQNISGVPQIKAILTHPFYNGSELVYTPGYDTKSQVYLDMKKSDTQFDLDTEANSAKDDIQLWEDLLSDFPFESKADFENAIGYMLTLIVRQGLSTGEVSPMFDVTAPREGVGKSLLADVLTAAVTGSQPITRSLGSGKGDIEKEIGAAFRSAPEVVIFDNVNPNQKLDSGILASVITNPKRAFRVLGFSEEAFFENRTVLLYTGSNVEVTGELAKRIAAIRLADTGKPEKDRSVKIESILKHTIQNRDVYLSSLLRMIQRWIDADAPESEKTTHRMRQWSRVIRGIMESNSFGEAFLENTDEVMLQANPDFTIWTNTFKAIADHLEDKAFEGWTAGDVFTILSHEEKVYAHEDDVIDGLGGKNYTRSPKGESILDELIGSGNDQSRKIKLGKLLRSKAGAVYGGLKLIDTHKSYRRTKVFCLENVGTESRKEVPF